MFNKPRNPKRIKKILKKVKKLWKKSPDLRFGQLIFNLMRESNQFYLEDDNFVKILQEKFKNINEKAKLH
jgi:uncharacterized protein YihD (DUF1040 family)